VRVTGTYNGTSFVYTGEFDAEMEFELSSPLVTDESGAADLTLFLDLDKWLRDSSGDLIDPATANSGRWLTTARCWRPNALELLLARSRRWAGSRNQRCDASKPKPASASWARPHSSNGYSRI
jgi:hypothetical protein